MKRIIWGLFVGVYHSFLAGIVVLLGLAAYKYATAVDPVQREVVRESVQARVLTEGEAEHFNLPVAGFAWAAGRGLGFGTFGGAGLLGYFAGSSTASHDCEVPIMVL